MGAEAGKPGPTCILCNSALASVGTDTKHTYGFLLLLLLCLMMLQVACTVRPAPSSSPCDVAFDPLSQQYLLVACTNGQLVVYAISDDFQLSQVRSQWPLHTLLMYLTMLFLAAKQVVVSSQFLLDATQVSTLAKQAAAQRRAAFVPTAPGNFVTVSDKSGEVTVAGAEAHVYIGDAAPFAT